MCIRDSITSDGKHVDSLHIALYQADSNGTLGPADLTVGEFDYTKGELAVGDTVSIYAGLRPDLRTLDTPAEQNGDLAYVKITGKNGKRYSYKNADAEDVIFEPDMLPLPADADQDTAANTVTVENKYLDFSSDVYANIDLDSQTTVDVGDFLMFYTGEMCIRDRCTGGNGRRWTAGNRAAAGIRYRILSGSFYGYSDAG